MLLDRRALIEHTLATIACPNRHMNTLFREDFWMARSHTFSLLHARVNDSRVSLVQGTWQWLLFNACNPEACNDTAMQREVRRDGRTLWLVVPI